jgi:GDP-4-dehydro-6-deoxy-D-mannose reductase
VGPRSRCTTNVRRIDLADKTKIAEELGAVKPDAVIHAAGRVHGTMFELLRDNAITTGLLCNAIMEACPSAILTLVGSAAEYGAASINGKRLSESDECRPTSNYGYAKLASSRYVIAAGEHGLHYNIVRVFNPVGTFNSPSQVLGAFMGQAINLLDAPPPRKVILGRLDAIRDFIALEDVMVLIVRLLERRMSGQIVNACSGIGHCIRDLIQLLVTTSQLEYQIVEHGEPPALGDQDVVVGDPTRFLALSGLDKPTPIEPILKESWHRAFRHRLTET